MAHLSGGGSNMARPMQLLAALPLVVLSLALAAPAFAERRM